MSLFSDRSDDYKKYRPDYPDAVVDLLRERAGWKLDDGEFVVADLGCGTGIASRKLLETGAAQIWGVEPSPTMLEEARVELGERYPGRTRWILGGAEALPAEWSGAVDAVAIAQAFHWMDAAAVRQELLRVLRPRTRSREGAFAPVALFWNRWDVSTPFGAALEQVVLRHCPKYPRVRDLNLTAQSAAVLDAFFGAREAYELVRLPHEQVLSLDGLLGRLRSCAFVPLPHTAEWEAMELDLRSLFHTYRSPLETVSMTYEFLLFFGSLN